MSFFDLFRKKSLEEEVREEMCKNNIMGYRDRTDRLNYQQSLLDRVNAAAARCRQNHDLDAVIKEFEFAFIESDPPCHSSQNLDLANFYIKAGENDKAYHYLNRLISTQEAPQEKAHLMQARILKKEKRYAESLKTYLIGHKEKYTFNENVFFKDIAPIINKLGLEHIHMEYLSSLITESKGVRPMINSYYKALDDWGIS